MIIIDRVYGEQEIEEPVLLALIDSAPVQRLKRINQAGASQYVIAGKDVTRYEHSLGVMLLLRRLGAPLEEQIAGLLHDVPHTAFSHVVDFVFKSHDHTYHEEHHRRVIMESEIPAILAGFGIDVERILDEKGFPLLERALPGLCADRIDYTLRDGVSAFGRLAVIEKSLRHLAVHENEIVFTDFATAEQFARFYLKMDESTWSHPIEVAVYQILADAIRLALERGFLAEAELFKDDRYVYDKLRSSDDPDIQAKLDLLNPRLKVTQDEKDYTFHAVNKFRFVDPTVFNGTRTARVSELSPEFRKRLAQHKALVTKGVYAKIVSW